MEAGKCKKESLKADLNSTYSSETSIFNTALNLLWSIHLTLNKKVEYVYSCVSLTELAKLNL